ncbi:MAG: hypothetical protein RL721_1691, partial [Candidatus Eisenbacteria bacterium]
SRRAAEVQRPGMRAGALAPEGDHFTRSPFSLISSVSDSLAR